MHIVTRPVIVFLCLSVLSLVLFPIVGGEFYTELVTKIMILAIFTISLDLLIGFTGLVSFGHAAFFGLGAYFLAILFQEADPINYWWALTVTLACTGVAALAVGWVCVRTSGIYFIMLTLAFAQMFYYFFFESSQFGGDDGIFMMNKPEITLGSRQLIDLENEHHFYYFVLTWLVGIYLFLSMILRSPFGHVLTAIKVNEQRVRALGYSTRSYKLVGFVIAGTIAGLAGFLEAAHVSFITPAYMSWHESGIAIVMVVLGGMGTLYGAVIGAFVVVLLQDFLPEITEHWQLLMGVIIIAVVLFLPNGIAGIIQSVGHRFSRDKANRSEHV